MKGATIMRYLNFTYTTNVGLARDLGLPNSKNAVYIFHKEQLLTPNEPEYVEMTTNQTIYQWVLQNYLLPVDIYTKYTSLYFDVDSKPLTLLLFKDIDLTVKNTTVVYLRNELSKLAEKLKPYTSIAIASEAYWRFMSFRFDTQNPAELVALKAGQWYKCQDDVLSFSLSSPFPSQEERAASLNTESPTYYPLFNPDTFEKFVKDVYFNRTEPFVRSLPIPAERHKKGILQLVGKNFQEELSRPGHEFFIMFYAPWNPRCKQFRKVMENLANGVFKDVDYIHFAELDSSENYVPEKFVIGALPTIYFVKENYKPMIYKEKKTEEQVENFIERYSNYYKKESKKVIDL